MMLWGLLLHSLRRRFERQFSQTTFCQRNSEGEHVHAIKRLRCNYERKQAVMASEAASTQQNFFCCSCGGDSNVGDDCNFKNYDAWC
jgi:hypothetical protein